MKIEFVLKLLLSLCLIVSHRKGESTCRRRGWRETLSISLMHDNFETLTFATAVSVALLVRREKKKTVLMVSPGLDSKACWKDNALSSKWGMRLFILLMKGIYASLWIHGYLCVPFYCKRFKALPPIANTIKGKRTPPWTNKGGQKIGLA